VESVDALRGVFSEGDVTLDLVRALLELSREAQ
jgi:hypothetical protein